MTAPTPSGGAASPLTADRERAIAARVGAAIPGPWPHARSDVEYLLAALLTARRERDAAKELLADTTADLDDTLVQLLAARRGEETTRAELVLLADKLIVQSDESLARYNRLRERCEGYKVRAARAFADGLEAAARIVCPEPHVEEERDCADIATQIRALAATPEEK